MSDGGCDLGQFIDKQPRAFYQTDVADRVLPARQGSAADREMLSFPLPPQCLAEIGAWLRRQWLSPDKGEVIPAGEVKQTEALSSPV